MFWLYYHRNMSSDALQHYARTAARAAVAAGRLLARSLGRHGTVKTKRSPIDLVTKIDKAAERLIDTTLRRAHPDVGFLGEERGTRDERASYRWVVDPLDGTNNFVHGFPMFAVSIGLEDRASSVTLHRTRMLVGVIYDPLRRELFVAVRGQGAWLNGKPLHVSPTKRLSHSLLSTGFSSAFLRKEQPYLGWFAALQRSSHGVRRIGSTVLSLASVAAGRLEGFYEQDLWPWDMAAGMLIVEEAGGRISRLDGGPVILERHDLVATNSHIHRELLRTLTSAASQAR